MIDPGAGVEEAARRIVAKLEAGWNAADAVQFAEPFEEDADFVTVLGERVKGRGAIRDGHAAIFATIYKDSVVEYRIAQLRRLGSETAVLHLDSRLEAPVGPLAGTNNACLTLVLVDRDGEWRIAALHNTLVREQRGQPASGPLETEG